MSNRPAPAVVPYSTEHLPAMTAIWNEVVVDGIAFPQEDQLSVEEATAFFAEQTHCGVALDHATGEVLGLYILHPNNVGRCGHISNASYAVGSKARGRGAGRALVSDCIQQARTHGFKVLQFNAVVATNTVARKLYESLGFVQLGTIPGGFRMPDGTYEDICPYYLSLWGCPKPDISPVP